MPKLCQGRQNPYRRCDFGIMGKRRQAAVRCVFCDEANMEHVLLTDPVNKTRVLHQWEQMSEERRLIALEYVPLDLRAAFHASQSSYCSGKDGEPCTFALTRAPRADLRVRLHGKESCMLCGPIYELDDDLEKPGGLQKWAVMLRKMSPTICTKALQERIPVQWFEELTRRLAADTPAAPGALLPAAADPLDDVQALQLWAPYLEQRRANIAEPTSAQIQEYRKRVLDDRRHGLNSMHMKAPRVQRGEEVSNDIALPPAPKHKADGSVDLAGR
eukprot:1374510-Karenia_brevis.AAC.1